MRRESSRAPVSPGASRWGARLRPTTSSSRSTGAPHRHEHRGAHRGGFGYVWGASTADLLGGARARSAYEPVQAQGPVTAARSRLRLTIARDTRAVSLRIHGTHGPPRIVLRGPRGVRISSPSHGTAKLRKGHYLIVANKSDGTTNVMLIHPAPATSDRECGSRLRVVADEDLADGLASRRPPRSEPVCSGRARRAPCGSPTWCRRERRCSSSSVRRGSSTRSSRPSMAAGVRACPGCALHRREDPVQEHPVPSVEGAGRRTKEGPAGDAQLHPRLQAKNIADPSALRARRCRPVWRGSVRHAARDP